MSLAPEAFEVDCPQISIVCGIYLREKPKFYKQVGDRHSLEVCDDNSWGIFYGTACICYALEKTIYPSAVKSWVYQDGKSWDTAPKMKVRAISLDSQELTASRSNPCYVEKASDWELVEERQGYFKPSLTFYRNKVTGAKQRDIPAIITRQLIAATARPVSSQAGNQPVQTNISASHHNQQQQPPPEAYEVDCPQVSMFSGIYHLEKPKFYKQVGNRHSLEVCEDDFWGIFHGTACVCYALEKTLCPSAVKSWVYQHGKSYRAAPKMKVRAMATTSRLDPCYVEGVSEWELVEERQAMFKPSLKFYKNKVTGSMRRDVPAIIDSLIIAAEASQPAHANNVPSHYLLQQLQQQQQKLSALNPQSGASHSSQAELPPPASSVTFHIPSTSSAALLSLADRYVLRDAPADASNLFPSGAQIRAEFLTTNACFEAFAYDALNSLKDQGHPHSPEFFTTQVMVPLFAVTHRYITDLVATQQENLIQLCGESARWREGSESATQSPYRQFFLATQQSLLLERVSLLGEARIVAFVEKLGPAATIVLDAMQHATLCGIIGDGLRLYELVRFMLRIHVLALLSEPRCHLLPQPGSRLPYQSHLHTEILGPSVKRHGYIKDGEEVEVVFCGLCFRPADFESSTNDPVDVSAQAVDEPFALEPALVPALVRRLR